MCKEWVSGLFSGALPVFLPSSLFQICCPLMLTSCDCSCCFWLWLHFTHLWGLLVSAVMSKIIWPMSNFTTQLALFNISQTCSIDSNIFRIKINCDLEVRHMYFVNEWHSVKICSASSMVSTYSLTYILRCLHQNYRAHVQLQVSQFTLLTHPHSLQSLVCGAKKNRLAWVKPNVYDIITFAIA